MSEFDYHKGQTCSREPIICQEGFCSDCIIYQGNSWLKNPKVAELVPKTESPKPLFSEDFELV
jgi:hypothetical protein